MAEAIATEARANAAALGLGGAAVPPLETGLGASAGIVAARRKPGEDPTIAAYRADLDRIMASIGAAGGCPVAQGKGLEW